MYVYVYVQMYVCMCISIYRYIYVCIQMCIHLCIYLSIYIYIILIYCPTAKDAISLVLFDLLEGKLADPKYLGSEEELLLSPIKRPQKGQGQP